MIRYYNSLEHIDCFKIEGFFVGWKKPLSDEQLKNLLINSTYKVLAVDDLNEMVVGIITALSDNTNWAFIPYLEVLPDYQKQGIGKQLMSMMLANLSHINCIDLTCDHEMQPFYEQFGMLRSEGMVIRRYLFE
ncbi:MAG: GNAT family N-acetyltransferase [Spirochaetales bacterium]|nr:GNAT family N-acetyltransferase [Spirochaetales bacterium]